VSVLKETTALDDYLYGREGDNVIGYTCTGVWEFSGDSLQIDSL
jgi:hypothetical protein